MVLAIIAVLIIILLWFVNSIAPIKDTPLILDPNDGCEVYPGLYLGNAKFAANRALLKSLGITHIVNCAIEIPKFYPSDFTYLHLQMNDIPQQSADKYFQTSREFINKAIIGGGNVLVHCAMGISRSATIVISYLMVTLQKPYEEVLQLVRRCRPIVNPNSGFEEQLKKIKLS